MCVICLIPADKSIEQSEFDSMMSHNPDGFGLMYFDKGNLTSSKLYIPMFSKQKQIAWELAQRAMEKAQKSGSALALHFRIATHGEVSKANSHPFEIAKGYKLMHNGILSGYGSKEKSDSLAYAEKLGRMHRRYPGILEDNDFLEMVQEEVGSYNKIVIARSKNQDFCILNREKGSKIDGVWYSNLNHWPTRTYTYTPNTTNFRGGFGAVTRHLGKGTKLPALGAGAGNTGTDKSADDDTDDGMGNLSSLYPRTDSEIEYELLCNKLAAEERREDEWLREYIGGGYGDTKSVPCDACGIPCDPVTSPYERWTLCMDCDALYYSLDAKKTVLIQGKYRNIYIDDAEEYKDDDGSDDDDDEYAIIKAHADELFGTIDAGTNTKGEDK